MPAILKTVPDSWPITSDYYKTECAVSGRDMFELYQIIIVDLRPLLTLICIRYRHTIDTVEQNVKVRGRMRPGNFYHAGGAGD